MAWPAWALAWVGTLSLVAFAAMGLDKRAARRGRARTSERALLTLALAGGSPGVALGMLTFRHKTRKAAFLLPFAFVVVGQLALLYFLNWRV